MYGFLSFGQPLAVGIVLMFTLASHASVVIIDILLITGLMFYARAKVTSTYYRRLLYLMSLGNLLGIVVWYARGL